MQWVEFIKKHKTKVRILYWAAFALFMIVVGLPAFFFFYLFDEEQTKQMIIERFDHQKYNVEVAGRVVPKLWHGLSLELGSVIINLQDNRNLIEFNNVSCQLSWLNLLVGKYKVRRLAVNGVDVNEANIINSEAADLLDFSNKHNDAFSDIRIIEINNIKSVGESTDYPISNGVIKFDASSHPATFKIGLQLPKINTFVTTQGSLIDINDGVLQFNDFMLKVYNQQGAVDAFAIASYDTKTHEFLVNNVNGKIMLNGYAGKLEVSQISLSSNSNGFMKKNKPTNLLDITHLKAFLDANNDFMQQHINITTDKIQFKDLKQIFLDQLKLHYVATQASSKFELESNAKNFVMNYGTLQMKSNLCDNNLKYTSERFSGKNELRAVLSGVCEYNLNTKVINLNLGGTFNNAPAKVALQVVTQKTKPYIKVDGVIDNLDFSRLKLQSEKLLPLYNDESGLPFSWLSLVNMDANLKVKSFVLDRISLDNLVTKLNIVNDQLDIYKISADIYGGKLSGSAKIVKLGGDNGGGRKNKSAINNDNYTISLHQNLYHLNLQKMLDDLFNITAISGIANLGLNINIIGAESYVDLHKKLNGQIVIDAKKGAFQGVDFNLFANPASISLPTGSRSTIFESLAAKLNFVNGVSKSGNLTFTSPYVIANGDGSIDFIDSLLNYKLNIKSVLPQNIQKANSVVIPVVVSGSLFSPKIFIQNMHLSTNLVAQSLNKTKIVSMVKKKSSKKLSSKRKARLMARSKRPLSNKLRQFFIRSS